MSRVRLTKRAADMGIPYPGNVNQPDRKDPKWDKYHTFKQTVNHELPDMRHDWQNDERDDIGFGVSETWGESPKTPGAAPTVASVRMAANKAVRIAVLLLGEKVEDEVIEEQARDLMSMSASSMDRTLARFADTQKLYAEEKEDEKKAEEKDEKEEVKAEDKKEEVKAEDKKDEEKKAVKKDEEKKAVKKDEEKKAEDKKGEPPAFIKEKIEESKKGSKELAKKMAAEEKEEVKAEECEEEVKAEDKKEEVKAEDKKEEVKKARSNELDVSFAAAEEEEEEEVDEKTASALASIFEGKDSTAAEELDKVEESKKAGIKKLGGQPRVASAEGAGVTDISNIWNTAPDVSEIFR